MSGEAGVVPLRGREKEPQVVALLALSQGHLTPDEAEARAPFIAEEYAAEPSLRLWGYEDAGVVLGLIGVQAYLQSLRIRDLAVLPQLRRRGIGRALVQHVCREHAFGPIWGETLAAAVDFYRSCGFQVYEDGTMPHGRPRYRFVM